MNGITISSNNIFWKDISSTQKNYTNVNININWMNADKYYYEYQ